MLPSARLGFVYRPAAATAAAATRTKPSICCRSNLGMAGRKLGVVQAAALPAENGGWFKKWAAKQEPPGERIMRSIATATASPLAQYIASPVTILHSLDPRVKQIWLVAVIVLSSRAHMIFRLGTVLFLVVATVLCLPSRVWKDQLGRTILLSAVLFITAAVAADGVAPLMQVRTPPPAMESLPPLPPSLSGYKYVVFKWGPIQLTRKGLALAAAASCLSFTVLQSASLCLSTTTPEQLTAALRWFTRPLSSLGVPVDEMTLSLLLSLRFVGLVFDEMRNIALAVVARGIQWRSLKLREIIDCYATVVTRLFKNLFYHSEHIAEAMVARGYRGDPEVHRFYFLKRLSFTWNDAVALAALALVFIAAAMSERLLF